MDFELTLTGTRPLLQHNGRLANPLDRYTQELKQYTKKTKKTDEDYVAIMQIEARGGCWETADGLIGVPNAAVWRCLFDAATAYKRGQDIKRALTFEDSTVPLLIDGDTVPCDVWLKDADHIFYRSVVVQRRRTMRARPFIPADWVSVHRFELLTDIIDPRDLVPILERAGRIVGLGDWRPVYGTFTPAVTS